MRNTRLKSCSRLSTMIQVQVNTPMMAIPLRIAHATSGLSQGAPTWGYADKIRATVIMQELRWLNFPYKRIVFTRTRRPKTCPSYAGSNFALLSAQRQTPVPPQCPTHLITYERLPLSTSPTMLVSSTNLRKSLVDRAFQWPSPILIYQSVAVD